MAFFRVSNGGTVKAASGSYQASTSNYQPINCGFEPQFICCTCVISSAPQIWVYNSKYDSTKQILGNASTGGNVVSFPATQSNSARLLNTTSTGFQVCKAQSGRAGTVYWFAMRVD